MRLILGKAEVELAKLESESVESLICDPPAGIKFMGKNWDSDRGGRDKWIAWLAGVMEQCLWCCRPGAHGLVWALPRTSHWTAMALENAGWEVRDVIMHVFGSGFPKSKDVSKAIDGVIGTQSQAFCTAGGKENYAPQDKSYRSDYGYRYDPKDPDAQLWNGWGTALKPAAEHWILVRKPLVGTVAANVVEHGTGGINVDGCRVEYTTIGSGNLADNPHLRTGILQGKNVNPASFALSKGQTLTTHQAGRHPPHLLLSHCPDCAETCVEGCPVKEMDEQSGERKTGGPGFTRANDASPVYSGPASSSDRATIGYDDTMTGASRFFPCFRYQSKSSSAERHAGCDDFYWRRTKTGFELIDKTMWDGLQDEERAHGNVHPTIKGLALMRWLCRLITPPEGVVLDPFMGSGTTGMAAHAEGFSFIGIEQEVEYVELARARIEYYAAKGLEVENSDDQKRPQKRQQSLF